MPANSATRSSPAPGAKFTIGPLQVRVADAFGLVELGHSFAAHSTLVVTPAITQLPRRTLAGSWHGEGGGRNRTAATAGEDDVVPRAYRDGDELRRVHWRSTARHGELMVRREEQRWRNRAVLLLDTRACGHSGTGAGSSFEFAVSAVASIGVHLAQAGLDGQLVTDRGAVSAPGTFEDVAAGLARGHQGVPWAASSPAESADCHGGSGGLLVAVAGTAVRRRGPAARRGPPRRGTAMALLLAVPTWVSGHADGRMLDEADAAAAILRAAGWRAVTVTAQTPLRSAWERLHHGADLPSRGSAGWLPAGTPQ